ncbi:MAG: hypothetical protein ACRDTH_19085 [Pseudonocardiaceae bacterium]
MYVATGLDKVYATRTVRCVWLCAFEEVVPPTLLIRSRRQRPAHDLNEDTLTRKRRMLGEDHPDTWISANNLAADLRARWVGTSRPSTSPRTP